MCMAILWTWSFQIVLICMLSDIHIWNDDMCDLFDHYIISLVLQRHIYHPHVGQNPLLATFLIPLRQMLIPCGSVWRKSSYKVVISLFQKPTIINPICQDGSLQPFATFSKVWTLRRRVLSSHYPPSLVSKLHQMESSLCSQIRVIRKAYEFNLIKNSSQNKRKLFKHIKSFINNISVPNGVNWNHLSSSDPVKNVRFSIVF